MSRRLSILLAGPSLFALATTAGAQPATTQPAAQSADPATVAQEANDAAEAVADEGAIIITARRRAESLLEVPQTVSAVTGKDLQEFNLTKFEDISQLVPGLNLSSDNTGFNATASTRGVSFSVASQGTPTVEAYINEHPVEPNMMFQGQFDVGQIEVLKGPQGTQRGRSAPSGAMTLTTRRPDLNEIGGSVGMIGNSHGGINFQAALGAPIIQDVLAIRVAGLIDRTNQGGIESVNNAQNPYGNTWAIRGSLRFEPTDTISAVVVYQKLERKFATFGGISFGPGAAGVNSAATTGALTDNLLIPNTQASPFQPCAPAGVGACAILPGGRPRIVAPANFNGPALTREDELSISDFIGGSFQSSDLLTAQLDWTFAGQKLSYVFGWSKFFLDSRGGGGDASNTIVGRESSPLHVGNVSTEKRHTHELRLSSDERLFGMIDYTLGGYHGKTGGPTSSPTFQSWAGAFGSPLGLSAVGGPGALTPFTFTDRYGLISDRVSHRENLEKAVFASVIAHLFNDKLELEAGARQIWYSATKSQATTFEGGVLALRNPNGLGPCPATLSGVSGANVPFRDQAVIGSTYPGTCDVQLTLNTPTNPFGGIRPSPLDQPLGTRKWDPFIYRLSASYKFTPDYMAYVSYGTSWRAGPGPITGAPTCSASLTPGFPEPDLCERFLFLEPEKSKGLEVGFKGAMFDRRLSFTVAAYKQKFDGLFVFNLGSQQILLSGECIFPHVVGVTTQPAGCTPMNGNFTFNAPVDTKGIDFDFNFRVSEDLNFGGAASWSKSKFAGGNIPCRDTNFDGVPDSISITGMTGQQYLNAAAAAAGTATAPESAYGAALCSTEEFPALKPNVSAPWNFNLRAEYSHEVFTGGRGFVRALFNYTPKNKNLNPATTFIPKGYGLLNLFAGIRAEDGAWEFSVAGRNILNNRRKLTEGLNPGTLTRPPSGTPGENLSFAPGTTNLSGYSTVSFVAPREFQVSARFAFGSR